MNSEYNPEESLLHWFKEELFDIDIHSLQLEALRNGHYLEVLNSTDCEKIFQSVDTQGGFLLTDTLTKTLHERGEFYLSQKCPTVQSRLEFLSVGIASLHGFLQSNWTGPNLSDDCISIAWLRALYANTSLTDSEIQEHISNDLILDGESCWVMKHQELLLVARVVLELCAEKFTDLMSCKWWLLRCLFVHQQSLEEHSPILHARLMSLIEEVSSCETILATRGAKIEFHLEAARINLYFGQVTGAKEHVVAAAKAASMTILLVGALGKRTRYQQTDLAQLTLRVTLARDTSTPISTLPAESLPRDVSLGDDVRLDRVEFACEEDGTFPALQPVEQAVVMAMFALTQKSQPKDRLADEELMPYLTCLLAHPRSWSLHSAALLMRCFLESNHRRTVERSVTQAQSLVDCVSADIPAASHRIREVFTSHLPHRWAVEAELAALLVSLGAFNSALDIYTRLSLWEEVIVCYNLLNLRHKAAEVIRQELGKRETVKLWCLLGDATDDEGCYEKAWELSQHRSARSQRHWGLYHFHKKQYATCIPHLQLSLSLNNIQPNVWFTLGFAALDQEDWALCAQAYRRYCEIDLDTFEAWNNLAKAYVKLGEKARAWRTLQEAVRCNYENWQVWDNLMAVSTDCGEFEEVIRAYHRLLDLKGKHVDEEVLKILVKAVAGDLKDGRGLAAGRLKKTALSLFGRLTGQVTTNAALWQMYAQLTASVEEQTAETLERTAQFLQRAHRAAVQSARWPCEVDSCVHVIELCNSLAGAYLTCCERCTSDAQALKLLSSAKLSLQGVIVKVKKEHFDLPLDGTNEAIVGPLQNLELKLEQVVEKINKLHAT